WTTSTATRTCSAAASRSKPSPARSRPSANPPRPDQARVASPGPIWIRLGPLPSFLGRKPMIASKSCKARVLCLAIAAVLAMPAMAQQAGTTSGTEDNDDQVKPLDRLTVTGSRINRIEVEQALPITTVTREEIDQQ